MEKRSMFKRLFGKEKEEVAPIYTQLKLIDDTPASFTQYNGNFQLDPDVLTCVDAIARNGAKMSPKHIREYKDDNGKNKIEHFTGRTYKLLARQPNEFQNAYQFYYQIISMLELYNDVFIYIKKDDNLKIEALYPLVFTEGKYYEYGNIALELKITFHF